VPHAGLTVPSEVKEICQLTKKEIREDGDEGAEAIYYPLKTHVTGFVTTRVARAVLDMNRAENDRRKDGIIKTHTCWDVPVYKKVPTKEMLDSLIDKYYRPYHKKLTEFSKEVRLGIDCHTMAAFGPPVGPDPGIERPYVCLSNADRTCPQEWMEIITDCFKRTFNKKVLLNSPFKGGYIIKSHSQETPWIQLEFSRADFMSNDEKRIRLLDALIAFFKRAL
jgi:formiminoglutamase